MNVTLLVTSFVAGLLTVIAPCVLPLLPVIVGGSLIDKNKWRPLIIVISLALSVVVFTLLLKVFTLFIDVPQEFWKYFSGGIVLLFGFTLVFPSVWDLIAVKLHLSQGSEGLLHRAQENHSAWSAIFLGAALGPVFSSCSPTYFVILATVLPVSFEQGLIYLLVYALGLAVILYLIAILGRVLTSKLKFVANPGGWFKRGLGVLLVMVGFAVLFGLDKMVEEYLIEKGFGSTSIERNLLKGVDLNSIKKKEIISNNEINGTTGINVQVVDGNTNKVSIVDGMEDLQKLEWIDANAGELANFGPAPELVGLQNWINSNPLTLKELRGKVVLIDFWTYSCINCIRTLPYIQKWHEQYSKDGLVVIGVHDPEFQFEKKLENVQQAVKDRGLTYPIVQDNDRGTWNVYNNHYWPAKYIIDKEGNLRYYHFGEGDYIETEEVIQTLLNMNGSETVAEKVVAEKGARFRLTDEIYLGSFRRSNMVLDGDTLLNSQWSIGGGWNEDVVEKITTSKKSANLRLNFYASTANLVLGGNGSAKVMVDGKLLIDGAGRDVKNGLLKIDGERLYQLINFGADYKNHLIEIIFDQAGIDAYAWTFG